MHSPESIHRRGFLGSTSLGLGSLALAELMSNRSVDAQENVAEQSFVEQGAVKPLHFPPRAKRVIFLCMAGGPSHLETFDYKPELAKMMEFYFPPS